MKKSIIILCVFLLLMSNSGCLYAVNYEKEHSGRVVDAETGEPIEGVVVLGSWYVVQHGPAGGYPRYYDAQETTTDKNGEFRISGKGVKVMGNVEPMSFVIFKAGYEYVEDYWGDFEEDPMPERYSLEDHKLVISLRKLTKAERRKGSFDPPLPPGEAPYEKVMKYLEEYNNERIDEGLKPLTIWGDTQL